MKQTNINKKEHFCVCHWTYFASHSFNKKFSNIFFTFISCKFLCTYNYHVWCMTSPSSTMKWSHVRKSTETSTIYFSKFTSGDGRVHKIVQWTKDNEEPSSILLDVFDVTPGESIQAMEISKEHKALYVASDYRVKQIDLVMCNRRYDNCLRCVHDPYCGWDKDSNVCKPYSPG